MDSKLNGLRGSHTDGTEETYLEALVDLLPGPIMTVPLRDGIGHAHEDLGQIVLLPEPELLRNTVVNGLGSNCLGLVQVLAGVFKGGLHGLDLCGDGSNLMFSALNDLFGLHVIPRAVVDTTVELKPAVSDGIVLGNGSQNLVEKPLAKLASGHRDGRLRRIVSIQRCLICCISIHFGQFVALVGAGGLHPSGRDGLVGSRLSWGGSGVRGRREKIGG